MAIFRSWLILTALLAVFAQSLMTQSQSDSCSNHLSCHSCIQTKDCSWCSKPSMDPSSNNEVRCFASSNNFLCDKEFIVNPRNVETVIDDKPLSKVKKSEVREEIVQISPQKISLKLRLNEPQRIKFRYSRAEDYPVDLYYLMDLSKSMEDDKNKLSKLGDLLATTMKNITKDFRLGFGSFVDKPLMPFTSTVPEKLISPCAGCAAPYGFKNHMSLDTNTARFSQEVSRSQISGNIDTPEGGFDALMQVIVCDEEIGWRSQARRLVVFSTDAGSHVAGDAKLTGIVTPNDGKCHVESHGYTHSALQDYPSVPQINKVAKKNAINLIFAVTKDQVNTYERLSKEIEGSSYAEMEDDSSNIVDIIRDGYNKISSKVEIKDDANSFVTIKYFSKCMHGSQLIETNHCDDLQVHVPVEFEAEIIATACPKNPQTVKIYPVGVDEALVLEIDPICECPCEKPSDPTFEPNSAKCNSHGTHKCGTCDCDNGFYGRKCECSSSDGGSSVVENCRADNSSLVDCNGRGNCICGECICHARQNPEEKITGRYCECDNFSCERHNERVCAGPEHGTCVCGSCECANGWTGPACECATSTESCKAPGDTQICSGHGICACGECQCEVTPESRYSGLYCERCQTCAGRCAEFKDCVECKMYQSGALKDECEASCMEISVETAEKLEIQNDFDHICTAYDDKNCRFQFIYNDRDEKIVSIRAQKEPDCPPVIFTLGVILMIIGAIVLTGLATLLLWKLFTTINDRREYARFLEETKNAKWTAGKNPLYREATTRVQNPTYRDN
ncbi:integrin beta-PS-like [Culicoides brevitarsis]|uniref:integrin beta-PS-like n=1 Tax=Culicoides brevitarsis TaxID=469753 RepID=UPI00307C7960